MLMINDCIAHFQLPIIILDHDMVSSDIVLPAPFARDLVSNTIISLYLHQYFRQPISIDIADIKLMRFTVIDPTHITAIHFKRVLPLDLVPAQYYNDLIAAMRAA